jgi:hypothetical protein
MQKRQLSDVEKQKVIEKHTSDGVLRCFVDGAPMEDLARVQFHHITPFSEEGPTDIDNMAPVCIEHHKRIRTLSLQEFRDKLTLGYFFEENSGQKDGVRLDNVLAFKLGENKYGKICKWEAFVNYIKIYRDEKPEESYPLYKCPVTGFKYFYMLISIEYLRNDIELQPRPLEAGRMWELYRHFLRYTQLAPAVCRLVDGQILLFDGQHKTASQIWAGRQQVECKIYINPDPRAIKETVLAAHDKLRQMPFYTSTLVSKYSDLFKEDWEDYVEKPGQKSEAGFIEFLVHAKGLSRVEAIKRLKSAIENDILEDPDNLLQDYIAEKNKSRKTPLRIHALQRTFFAEFIAQPPMNAEFEGPEDHRQEEKKNFIRLLNLIVNATLAGRWNPDAKNDAHRTAERIYAAGSLRTWVPMLRAVMAVKLNLIDDEERRKVFYREVDDDKFSMIEPLIERFFSHKIWIDPDPEIDRNLRVNNIEHVKQFLNERGLSSTWLLNLE